MGEDATQPTPRKSQKAQKPDVVPQVSPAAGTSPTGRGPRGKALGDTSLRFEPPPQDAPPATAPQVPPRPRTPAATTPFTPAQPTQATTPFRAERAPEQVRPTEPTKAEPAKTTPAQTTPAKTVPAKAAAAEPPPAKTTPAKKSPEKATPAAKVPAKAALPQQVSVGKPPPKATPAKKVAVKKAAVKKAPAKAADARRGEQLEFLAGAEPVVEPATAKKPAEKPAKKVAKKVAEKVAKKTAVKKAAVKKAAVKRVAASPVADVTSAPVEQAPAPATTPAEEPAAPPAEEVVQIEESDKEERPGEEVRAGVNPAYLPEALALAAVERLGEEARQRVDWYTVRYPDADGDAVSRAITREFVRRARRQGFAAGAVGSVGLLIEAAGVNWLQAKLVLHLAAAYGHDPLDRQRAAELLVLQRVHGSVEAAEAAIRAAEQEAGTRRASRGVRVSRVSGPLVRTVGAGLVQAALARLAKRLVPGAGARSGVGAVLGSVAAARSTEMLAARAIRYYRRR
jgi:hypothetical protein